MEINLHIGVLRYFKYCGILGTNITELNILSLLQNHIVGNVHADDFRLLYGNTYPNTLYLRVPIDLNRISS